MDDLGKRIAELEAALVEARAEIERREVEHRAHLKFLANLEEIDRVIRQAADLERMMGGVLDAVLAILNCDRAWLLFPCDPQAPSFRVPMERTREEWPGAMAMGVEIPVDAEAAEAFVRALASTEPVVYDPRTGRRVPAGERFHTLSQMHTAVHPTGRRPWVFGVHQCSYARVWTAEEAELFKEIARRIADGLGSLLFLRELRESERRYSSLAEAARDMVFVIGRDDRVEYVNRFAAERLGRRADEIVGMRRSDLFPGPVASRQQRSLLAVLDSGIASYVESEMPLGERSAWLGTWLVPLRDEAGRVTSVLGVSRDISERKRGEQALRESEQRFREFVEHAVVGVYRTTPDGRVLMANREMARLYGFPSVEALQAADLDELAARLGYPRSEFKRLLERDSVVTGWESRIRRPDGSTVFTRESARAVRDERGEVTFYEGTMEDLTEQKALEEQLRQSQKMEAVGRLAGGIAHDFNNLLQALLSHAQLVRRLAHDPDAARAVAAELEADVKRGAALARQLLLFSRRETARPERLDLGEVVRASSAMIRRVVRENIALAIELDPALLPIEADCGQIEQVLVNLVVNASDAMPDGGTLAIRAGGDGSAAWLEVRDNGHGIPDEIRDRIFEPFFTTKAAGQGTGLGLAVVHGIVTNLGGHIGVDTRIGGGTTMRVMLPLAAPQEAPAALAARVEQAPPAGRGERVLLIEDDDATRAGLREVLAGLGYDVTAAASGEEAGLLPAEPPFHALLTDLLLPGASGLDIAVSLAQRWPGIKVILMSGYAEDEAMRARVEDGTLRFLQKPFDMRTLAVALRAALDEV